MTHSFHYGLGGSAVKCRTMAAFALKLQDSHSISLALDFPERRRGISDLARGRQTLEHAVTYLVGEQARREENNQPAIMILCRGMGLITDDERRAPARSSMRRWMEHRTSV